MEIQRRDSTTPTNFLQGKQSLDDPLLYILSSEDVDRVGDVIRADGWILDHFLRNPIALYQHSHDKVIGTWENVRVEGSQLLGELNLAAPGTSALVDEVRALVEQRVLKAVSVGFMPITAQALSASDPYGGYMYTQAELSEASLVAVPANPHAIQIAAKVAPKHSQEFFVGDIKSDRPRLSAAKARLQSLGIKT